LPCNIDMNNSANRSSTGRPCCGKGKKIYIKKIENPASFGGAYCKSPNSNNDITGFNRKGYAEQYTSNENCDVDSCVVCP
jgi:hypothetical protein